MAERFKAPVLKTGRGVSSSWVRIPLHPPFVWTPSPTMLQSASRERPRVSLIDVAGVFLRLGITSFGGGTAGWVHRELVDRRRWLTEETFLTGLTVAQILPGANPVNLALYFGFELRGSAGAAAAALG